MMKMPAWSQRGMVVAEHPLAALAGYQTLRQGGNFADAVVAISAMLSVVTPHLCGLGGDFFGLFWLSGEKRAVFLNGSGWAPQNLRAAPLRRRYKKALPVYSPLTITIPGLVDALSQLHRRYGRLSWSALWQPAATVAREGFPVSTKLASALAANAKRLSKDEGARQVFFRNGRPLKAGEILRQPSLAATLEHIAAEGRSGFYESDLAKSMVQCLQRYGNPVTLDDFQEFTSLWGEPIAWNDRERTILEMPPNALGVATLQSMALLTTFPIARIGATELAGLASAVMRLIAQERDSYLADPNFLSEPPEVLWQPQRIALLRQRLTMDGLPISPPVLGDTTYFAVVDAEGNAASAIQSIFHNFGAGILDPQTGVLFHNRGANFTLQAGHPNELAGRKRPRHTLSAVIVLEGDQLKGLLGTSGGDHRPLIHVWLLVHWLYRGLSLQEAIEHPRVLWQGANRLLVEQGAGDPVALQNAGWQVEVVPYPPVFGTGVAHGIERKGESWCGCADIRGEGIGLPL